jgi:aminopeptidase N
MRTDTPRVIRLADYRPSDYLADTIDLDFRLDRTATQVRSAMAFRPNPEGQPGAPLALDGDELTLRGVFLDGEAVPDSAYEAGPHGLTLLNPPQRPFMLEVETEIDPTANTKLMGLYRSGGVYCTQCEADGFRRITYALDRPDVLSVYTTRIEADRDEAPVLLGNGNPAEEGSVEGTNRHYAVWHDPYPKPGYLFAIVAGDLVGTRKPFVTMSGRPVEIAVYVQPGKEDRAGYALDALERSMRWDERVFGREYDLDVFNVVAVPDFNMGAMENKGLNIFNDKYVLASPDTATDSDYANVEAVIAHEYFHNWTGNRITCRDWFQLCLKEGLTVFRDQEFSSDERSRPVHRIGEVRTLRSRQFAEDSGPLAHPVRPEEYREINNFYTATVYEKGAEIVRMLKTMLGPDDFARGMTRFFDTCDGRAVTVEDFLDSFAETSGARSRTFRALVQPSGHADARRWDALRRGERDLSGRVRPGDSAYPWPAREDPLVIPVAMGFVSRDGGVVDLEHERMRSDGVFLLETATERVIFENVPARPVPSLLRGFSAPVKLELDLGDDDLLALLRHDLDPFNRWQACQTVALRLMVRRATGRDPGDAKIEGLGAALASFLDGEAEHDPAFAAMVLTLPGEAEIAQEIGRDVDPDAVHRAREAVRSRLGVLLSERLSGVRDRLHWSAPYTPDAASAGRRALRNVALDLLGAGDPHRGEELAAQQLASATNMTDRLAALSVLALVPGDRREAALAEFGARYSTEPLVLDKWFAIQACIPEPGALERVRGLMDHPAFALSNPNRVRSLIGAFAMANPTQFHRPDGAGYALLEETVLRLNGTNPQVAARLLTAFGTWRSMESVRRSAAERSLRAIAGAPNLSPDVSDIVGRSLAQ